jgi:3-oxoacyl-[acyl-carrier protein] reductase
VSRFADRTVVVTGASRGLGRSIAVAFAREGAFVYAAFRDREREAAQTMEAIAAAGGRGAPVRFDVARPDEVRAAFDRIHAERSRVDVLVNNAGVARDAPFVLGDAEAWREVQDVNLGGAFHCTRAAVAPMIHARRGCIVNVASVSARRANPGQSAYAAAKGGLLSFSRTLAAELAPKGIRVNVVVPGMMDAGMVQAMDRRSVERVRERIPLQRLGTGEEVARAVLFLASDEASYIVGCELPVDGGLAL